jgi:hypothetical protein
MDNTKPSAWRIERTNDQQKYCVVRDVAQGKEWRQSASGRASAFKTWKAARRVRDALNHDEAIEAELRAKYASLPPIPDAGEAIARAVRGA